MKADLTRNTFNENNHFSRVLKQQGRPTLDADDNEQASILLHYIRTFARDIIGPYGGPADGQGNLGFSLFPSTRGNDIAIKMGRYYVDGILIENDKDILFTLQDDYPLPDKDNKDDSVALKEALLKPDTKSGFWLYLDVWERHITYIEQNSIRELALNGPDTCTRAKVVWQVKAKSINSDQIPSTACDKLLGSLDPLGEVKLASKLKPTEKSDNPCVIPPDSKYRRCENQLYRVEIHDPGTATTATFKWSRDNGSVVTPWLGTEGNDLLVSNVRGFASGNWVELSDEASELRGKPGTLVKLTQAGNGRLTFDSSVLPSNSTLPVWDSLKNPKVRRWDQFKTANISLTDGGAILVMEKSDSDDIWFDLEDGIQIQFSGGGEYRTGDYWLIPARVATGNIEWPVRNNDPNDPESLPPQGITHHYAPLGFVYWNVDGLQVNHCQCTFSPPIKCFNALKTGLGGRGT